MSSDEGVISTNDDASNCKRFAVKLGYWSDKYIQYFVRSAERRPPEISRGYYARTQGIKHLIHKFFQILDGKKCQIVSIGAGFDTLFWRLHDDKCVAANFIEVDFSSVTTKKCHYIKKNRALLEKLASEDGEDIRISNCELHSDSYHIVAADIRNINQLETKLITECGLDKNVPTLFLAECVLVYMNVAESSRILRWISSNFKDALFVNYEQVNMDDRFGQVMIDNLINRHCALAGVEVCKNIETQEQRFSNEGWDVAKSQDMMTVYQTLPQADIQRIESLEFLDEREILEQLMQHYCITVGYKLASNVALRSVTFT